jgi:transglutaminase-like putative cysteine protease
MRTPHRCSTFLFLLALLPAAVLGSEEKPERIPIFPRGKDLGANPSFEEGADGRPAGWFVFQPPKGMKAEWGAFGLAGTKGMRFTSPEGTQNRIPAAAANQAIDAFEAGKEIEVTAWFRLTGFRGTCIVWARCDDKEGPERREEAFQNSVLAGYELEGSTVWSPVTVRVTPGKETARVIFGVLVGGRGTVEVDEVRARVREKPGGAPVSVGPGLFKAEGRYLAVAGVKDASVKVWIPVPILWREQIPLTFRAWTAPKNLIGSVTLVRRRHGFHYAEIVLKGFEKGVKYDVYWESHVLVRPHEPSPIPKGIELPLKDVPKEVASWLKPSWCCDSKHAGVEAEASEIRKAGKTAELLIPATLERMSRIFRDAKGRVTNLTAVEALTRSGSCTSCANLGAALLRALGVPARILAGYPTWCGPLQTHYVVEYWLPEGGWRLMESTRCMDDRPGYEQIEVALVLPEDEAEEKAKQRFGAAGAVPFLSLTEYPGAGAGKKPSLWLQGNMPDRPGCDHQAVRVALFDAPKEAWAGAEKRLRERWRKLTDEAVESETNIGKLAVPAGLEDAKSLDDLLKAITRTSRNQ